MLRGITTSPLTCISTSIPMRSGTFPTFRAFLVTSSPLVPEPLVAALTNLPFRYSKDKAVPSNFGCAVNSVIPEVVLVAKCLSSSSEVALSRLCMGNRCSTFTDPGSGSLPTNCSWGCFGASCFNSSQRISNSASLISGDAST